MKTTKKKQKPLGQAIIKKEVAASDKRMEVRRLDGWTNCTDRLPPENLNVETKIDDGKGVRNIAMLRRYKNLWFFPDMSMYVYYSPTHWRY